MTPQPPASTPDLSAMVSPVIVALSHTIALQDSALQQERQQSAERLVSLGQQHEDEVRGLTARLEAAEAQMQAYQRTAATYGDVWVSPTPAAEA